MNVVTPITINDSSITIAVITHKPYRMPTGSIYMPLHVGASIHPSVLPDLAQDNTGDNISSKNAEYSELTGLYWVWKNIKSDFKGIVHYRRLFATPNSLRCVMYQDCFSHVICESELRECLAQSDVILPRRRNYVIESVYSHYIHTIRDGAVQLAVARDVIRTLEPNYLSAFDVVMNSRRAHMFNMFVMSSAKMNEYCSWLFPVLSEICEQVDASDYDSFNRRYPGRISEMLLDVWLLTKDYNYMELPVLNTEPVNWVKKGTSFLKAKFFHQEYIKSF